MILVTAKIVIIPSTIPSGPTINSSPMRRASSSPPLTNTLISSMSSNKWVFRFSKMLGKATTAAYSPTDKPAQANPTPWLDMEPTRVSSQSVVSKFLQG